MSDPTPGFSPEATAAREAKATPGPWEFWDDPAVKDWAIGRPEEVPGELGDSSQYIGSVDEQADADFIANARQDIPALLAALEAAEEERDEALATVRLWAPIVDAIRHPTAGDDAEVEYETAATDAPGGDGMSPNGDTLGWQYDPGLVDSGIRYCIAHNGVIEQDATVCDFQDDEDEDFAGECVSTPLFYAGTTDG